MTEPGRLLTISDLVRAFQAAHYPVSPSWIRRQEEKGNLILPKSTTNFKMAQGARRSGAVRQMTQSQIDAIIEAFVPEGLKLPNGKLAKGTGYFNYKKQNV